MQSSSHLHSELPYSTANPLISWIANRVLLFLVCQPVLGGIVTRSSFDIHFDQRNTSIGTSHSHAHSQLASARSRSHQRMKIKTGCVFFRDWVFETWAGAVSFAFFQSRDVIAITGQWRNAVFIRSYQILGVVFLFLLLYYRRSEMKVPGQRQATFISSRMYKLLRWFCATDLLRPFTFSNSFNLISIWSDLGLSKQLWVQGSKAL